jgi:putative ABC transport system permease protein
MSTPSSRAPGLSPSAILRLAWRESRTARRRLALYMSSIALGVAALVAIDSFAGNVTRSIREQSRALLGGDLQLSSRAELPAVVDTLIDSLTQAGVAHARVTTFASMALVERSGGTRLVQVRAVTDGYPFYGTIETSPANQWGTAHGDEPVVFVDPSLLISLDAQVGDSLRLGNQTFRIAAALGNVPGDAGITAVIGPRVFVSARWLDAMGLLQFGARAEYDAVLRLPANAATTRDGTIAARVLRRRIDPRSADRDATDEERERAAGALGGGERLDDTVGVAPAGAEAAEASVAPRVRVRTVADTERDFTEAVAQLANFLSVIGLIALLLGGIGVASGIHAFVVSKIDTVAVLRCLGASSRQVLTLYVLQAAVMGLAGAAVGTTLGVAIQFALPGLVSEVLPLDVAPTLEPRAIAMGLGIGVWVALVFALRPLLALRRVSPLQALRRATDEAAVPSEWRDPARLMVDVLLLASIVGIAISRTGDVTSGLAVTVGILVAVLVLWISATLLIKAARRTVRAGWPFAMRQGVANLYRPANQTRAVTLALGFGAFLLSTVYLVQSNLLRRFAVAEEASAGNLLFFDVQDDQVDAISNLVLAGNHRIVERTPIVTMRIASVNGRSAQALMNDTVTNRPRWVLRREFRSSYRDALSPSEELLSGTWTENAAERERRRGPNGPYEVSLEEGVAQDLMVALGDTVVWDVQGVRVPSVVTSIRKVNWARFETNFFAVFAPEALRDAPQQFVLIANVPDPATLAAVQRDAVRAFPNVSSLDLSVIRNTIGEIVGRVTVAVRFLGIFCLAIGVPVLFSAVAATRRARLREGVLLRTLGASRALVQRVLFAEYAALGVLGAFTGMLLSFGGAWALMRWVFEDTFVPAWAAAGAIMSAMVLLTVGIGLLTSRDVHRATPMAALRES